MTHNETSHRDNAPVEPDIKDYYANESDDPITRAFSKKNGVHPMGQSNAIPAEEMDSVFESLIQKQRKGKTAAYIHVPFCESHCLYCGFYRMGYDRKQSKIYTDALIKELRFHKSSTCQSSSPVHAVYLGGGTPTSLEAEDLKRLLLAVKENLPLANDCEITIEGRIKNFNAQKMEACIEGGANRFSLGVQTFDTELRNSMKRISTREEVIESLTRLRDFDQSAVVIDLIFGFPGQTMEMWENDIKTFHSLELEGADLYQLNIFPGTPLFTAIQKGKFPPAADIEAKARMFVKGIEMMESARYKRLSNEHWGRTFRERNIYNHLMKSPSNCLAFGPGAGGTIDNHFYMVEHDYKKWVESIMEKGRKPVLMVKRPTPNSILAKTITSEIEMSAINPINLDKTFDLPISSKLAPLYSQWIKAGVMEKAGDWYVLTTAGQFWQVNIAQRTINYLSEVL